MKINSRHIRAIFRKELREYQRNPQIVVFMTVYPLIFTIYKSRGFMDSEALSGQNRGEDVRE